MCGISGLVSFANLKTGLEIVHKMNERIVHRGPDAEGLFEQENVYLGHRRLSIIDLSEAANQPMQKHGYTLVFNGEIYNYIELREELKSLGYSFDTNSDSEVILSAYNYFGADCTKKFNGMWSFLLLDSSKDELFVSRDQFGIKPLYYYQTNELFGFASEIKQFLEIPGFVPKLNKSVAASFLIDGALNQTQETFFEMVHELKPGMNLLIHTKSSQYRFSNWYNLSLKADLNLRLTYQDAVEKFNVLFEDAVKIRMRSDVRVGSCLSGGIDSSAIVCKVRELNESIETVTSCYSDCKYDEQKYSDIVSQTTGFRAHKIYGDSATLDRIEILKKMVYHQDQPLGGGSHFSEYNVFYEAKNNGLVVMLDGQGSDEYLGGYPEFKSIHFVGLLKKIRLNSLRNFILTESELANISVIQIIKRHFKTLIYYPLVKIFKRILKRENKEYSLEFTSLLNYKKIVPQNFQELSILELEKTSVPFQLHSEDRNSMLFSIESRLPFLDYRLVEFCLSLPEQYKLREGYPKKILRDAVASLPKEIKERKDKMGFVSPDETWVRENSSYFVEKIIDARDKFNFVTNTFLHQFTLFLKGDRGYEAKYFRVISLVVFCEEFDLK
jgi:asparagine synthase (glutamine-hydrolysing)